MKYKCRGCAHDGCCEDLPYCNGKYFAPSEKVECDWCGGWFNPENLEKCDGNLLCPSCMSFMLGKLIKKA